MKNDKFAMDELIKTFVDQVKIIHGRTVIVKKKINTIDQVIKLTAKSINDDRVYLIAKSKYNRKLFYDTKQAILIHDGTSSISEFPVNPQFFLDKKSTNCEICSTDNVALNRSRTCTNCNGLWCIICQMKILTTALKRGRPFECPYCKHAYEMTDDVDLTMFAVSHRIDDELLRGNLTEDEANDLHRFMGFGVTVTLTIE